MRVPGGFCRREGDAFREASRCACTASGADQRSKPPKNDDSRARLRQAHERERDALREACESDVRDAREAGEESAKASEVRIAAAEAEIVELQRSLARLRERFEQRESRDEDVQEIATLRENKNRMERELRDAEDALVQLRRQMLLREENYNRHFKNGGAGHRVLDVGGALASAKKVTAWMAHASNKRFAQSKQRQ